MITTHCSNCQCSGNWTYHSAMQWPPVLTVIQPWSCQWTLFMSETLWYHLHEGQMYSKWCFNYSWMMHNIWGRWHDCLWMFVLSPTTKWTQPHIWRVHSPKQCLRTQWLHVWINETTEQIVLRLYWWIWTIFHISWIRVFQLYQPLVRSVPVPTAGVGANHSTLSHCRDISSQPDFRTDDWIHLVCPKYIVCTSLCQMATYNLPSFKPEQKHIDRF